MFGKYDFKSNTESYADQDLVRLAIPRRTYTQSHIDYVIEKICKVYDNKNNITGLQIIEEPKYLRHFTAKLERK